MTNAGDGDSRRLRVGGWLPDAELLPPVAASGAIHDDVWDPPAIDLRDGPTVEPNDWWDPAPAAETEGETYRGRRRLRSPTLRLWLAVGFVLLGLGAAVAIPMALTLSSDDATQPGASSPLVATDVQSSPVGSPTSSATATPAPGASPSASRPVTVAPAPYGPVSYEAEAPANVREGSARVRNTSSASGRKVVNRIGDWSDSEKTEASNGTLTFTDVTVPASGLYTVAIYYGFFEDDDTRSMLITVNQTVTRNVTVARPDECCQSSMKVSVRLQKGLNTIRFSNSEGPAPGVDKMQISRP